MLPEGYVAVLIDSTPMVMVVPGTLAALFQTADDYYSNYFVGSFTRVIRWLAALIGLWPRRCMWPSFRTIMK